jgi:hypothetical protein
VKIRTESPRTSARIHQKTKCLMNDESSLIICVIATVLPRLHCGRGCVFQPGMFSQIHHNCEKSRAHTMPKIMAVVMRTLLKKVPGTVSRTMVNSMDNLDDLCAHVSPVALPCLEDLNALPYNYVKGLGTSAVIIVMTLSIVCNYKKTREHTCSIMLSSRPEGIFLRSSVRCMQNTQKTLTEVLQIQAKGD